MFLHVVADTLGSLGVIISTLLLDNFGYIRADPLCSLFIAVMILISTAPLLKSSAFILMQRIPLGLESRIATLRQKVLLAHSYSITIGMTHHYNI